MSGELEPNKSEYAESGRAKLRKAFGKIKHALPKTQEESLNSAKVALYEENYRNEISRQIHIHGLKSIKMKLMSEEERDEAMLRFDDAAGILVDKNELPASTMGITSKDVCDALAFVMDKSGNIYVTQHTGRYSKNGPSTTHASILGGKPVEMAGLIKINNGQIEWISDHSGHYRPDKFDMFRGVAKLHSQHPSIFAHDAQVQVDKKKYELDDVILYTESNIETMRSNRVDKSFIKDLLQGMPVEHYSIKLPDLHKSALAGDKDELAKLLLAQDSSGNICPSGAYDVNEQDRFGNTALHYALAKHDLEVVRMLTFCGARNDIPNLSDKTALDYAKLTSLHQAHQAVFSKTIDSLSEISFEDINKKDSLGNTALHYAVAMNDDLRIFALLQSGADLSINNNSELSPIELLLNYYNKYQDNISIVQECVALVDQGGVTTPAHSSDALSAHASPTTSAIENISPNASQVRDVFKVPSTFLHEITNLEKKPSHKLHSVITTKDVRMDRNKKTWSEKVIAEKLKRWSDKYKYNIL